MMKKANTLILTTFLLLLLPFFAFADHDDDDHKDNDDHESEYLMPVRNDTYKQTCGACHFAYLPGLLPSGSWKKILHRLPSHFGENVLLDPQTEQILNDYLTANAAEKSSGEDSRKILKSLRGKTPLRITQTPYIREEHHDLSPGILKTPSIGSLSNCIACHTRAEQGNFDDDYVKIPRK